jgi:hypothetical protein
MFEDVGIAKAGWELQDDVDAHDLGYKVNWWMGEREREEGRGKGICISERASKGRL